jgi:lipopolysaccharide/colanic/teichoic acid biosynthesis glycosyltransferase
VGRWENASSVNEAFDLRVRVDEPAEDESESSDSPNPKDEEVSGLVIDLRTGHHDLEWTRETVPRKAYESCKRAFDVLVAVLISLLLSPALLAITIAVRLSSDGPVFFRQERVGRYGDRFQLLKYRTMYDGADDSHHRRHSEELANGTGHKLLIEDDPRVTPVGRFLRKWSLDELPNLWNVIKGDMSLVGPRPLVPYELMLHGIGHLSRLVVMPGITGLAQVNGRLHLSLNERADQDLVYVERRSFWFDVALLTRTIPALLTRPGA